MDRSLRPAEQNRRERSRQVRRAVRAGAPPAPCTFCGYFTDLPGLMHSFRVRELAEPLRQKVLQRHHPDGEEVSDFVVWLCIWCHAAESDAQQDLPDRLRHPRTREDMRLAILAGDARLFHRDSVVKESRAEWLDEYIREALMVEDEEAANNA